MGWRKAGTDSLFDRLAEILKTKSIYKQELERISKIIVSNYYSFQMITINVRFPSLKHTASYQICTLYILNGSHERAFQWHDFLFQFGILFI